MKHGRASSTTQEARGGVSMARMPFSTYSKHELIMSDSIPLFDNYLIAALQSAIKADPNVSAGGVVQFASECAFLAMEARVCAGQKLKAIYDIDINSGRPHVPKIDEDSDLDFPK